MSRKCVAQVIPLHLRCFWHLITGLYLQACGERSQWLPVRGEHVLGGIRLDFGKIYYVDAHTEVEESVALVDDFGEIQALTQDGLARLCSSGSCSATLIFPDGSTTERYRRNRYSTEIVCHAVTKTIARIKLGDSLFVAGLHGKLLVDGGALDLCSSEPWRHTLADGTVLEYRPFCELTHRCNGKPRSFVYAARSDRLFEIDRHRVEYRMTWVTSDLEAPAQVMDAMLTLYPETGDVQILQHSVIGIVEKISFDGPNGLRVLREEGSRTLYAYVDKQLVGIAEFCPNAGYEYRSDKVFNRWRFSSGNAVEAPAGNGWFSPITTAALLSVPLAVLCSILIDDFAAYAIALPVVIVILSRILLREVRAGYRFVTAR